MGVWCRPVSAAWSILKMPGSISSGMPLRRTSRAQAPSTRMRVRLCESAVTAPMDAGIACRSCASAPSPSLDGPTIQNCSGPVRNTRPAPTATVSRSVCGSAAPRAGSSARSTSAIIAGKAATCTRMCPRSSPRRQRRLPSAPSRPPFSSALANADFGSNMQALVLGVDELRRCDARPHPFVLQRIDTNDLLARMLEAALVEAEGDVFPELRRPGDGGDVAAAVAFDLVGAGEQDGAAAQPFVRLQAFQADQAPALGRLHLRPLPQLPPDIGLVLAGHLAEAEIVEAG